MKERDQIWRRPRRRARSETEDGEIAVLAEIAEMPEAAWACKQSRHLTGIRRVAVGEEATRSPRRPLAGGSGP